MHSGLVTVEYGSQTYKGRLLLKDGTLVVQKEELVYAYSPEHVDPSLLNKERVVRIKREKVGGLGLSIKGGSEHNLPILVSRIFKDQAADKTGQLFVGDSIIKVNDHVIENVRHEEAVSALKFGGDEVTLVVKYYRPASFLLSKNRRSSRGEHEAEGNTLQNGHTSELEKLWADLVTLSLTCAYVSRYAPSTDHLWLTSFQVTASDGTSSGVIHCEDRSLGDDWVQRIQQAISQQTSRVMGEVNKLSVPANQIVHMCWISTRTSRSDNVAAKWQREFIVFRGDDVCFFDIAPINLHDISRLVCDKTYKVYDSMFRVLKESELADNRQHCCVMESGDGSSHYVGLDSRQELLQLEKVWHRANYQAVKLLTTKTVGCTWRKATCSLTLDLSSGFSLYDNDTKVYRWSYKFSQLKRSSDDGTGRLLLEFWNDARTDTEIRDLECSSLRTLLFNIHAFLSAKLASVDPAFLINL